MIAGLSGPPKNVPEGHVGFIGAHIALIALNSYKSRAQYKLLCIILAEAIHCTLIRI